jgi:hypothetical protein
MTTITGQSASPAQIREAEAFTDLAHQAMRRRSRPSRCPPASSDCPCSRRIPRRSEG